MKWTLDSPKYGDMIRVKVRFYHHYGIFADENTVIQFGMQDNTGLNPDDITVLVTDIATFSAGETVEKAALTFAQRQKRRSPQKTVAYALSKVGTKGYNILHNNCEHFANECVFGEARSDFLEQARADIRKKLKNKHSSGGFFMENNPNQQPAYQQPVQQPAPQQPAYQPPLSQQPTQPIYTQPAPVVDGGSLLTKGILALVFSWMPIISFLGIIFGAQGRHLANRYLSQGLELGGKGTTGSILSKVGMIVGIVFTAFWAFYFLVIVALIGAL